MAIFILNNVILMAVLRSSTVTIIIIFTKQISLCHSDGRNRMMIFNYHRKVKAKIEEDAARRWEQKTDDRFNYFCYQ